MINIAIELVQTIGLGLVVLLPIANPLTTVVLLLSLSSSMTKKEVNHEAKMASIYVFIILVVSYYAGQLVMNTFGISIPGLRIAGGLIVAYLGFRMLFPQQTLQQTPEAKERASEIRNTSASSIAFIPLAMPSTAGPGTIALIISSASTVKNNSDLSPFVLAVAPVLVFASAAIILWLCLRSANIIIRIVGKSGIEAISRFMGFILVCMGVQFIINGCLEIINSLHAVN